MTEKKRSTYNKGSKLDLPKHIDSTKYGYRWISSERLAENSDGYEPRGWEIDKSEEGKTTRRGDLVLGRMPIDMFTEMKEQKDTDRKDQMQLLLEKQSAEEEKEFHEIKKKGGRVKFEFKQE
jgi:hypothetical protein